MQEEWPLQQRLFCCKSIILKSAGSTTCVYLEPRLTLWQNSSLFCITRKSSLVEIISKECMLSWRFSEAGGWIHNIGFNFLLMRVFSSLIPLPEVPSLPHVTPCAAGVVLFCSLTWFLLCSHEGLHPSFFKTFHFYQKFKALDKVIILR